LLFLSREGRKRPVQRLALANNANAANGERRFHAGFIALPTVAVKPHSQSKDVAFSEPSRSVSFY
jgi:hypothetical protein